MTRRQQWPDWVSAPKACADAGPSACSTNFFMYTEDVDFCAAIRADGFTPQPFKSRICAGDSAASPSDSAAYRQSRMAFYEASSG